MPTPLTIPYGAGVHHFGQLWLPDRAAPAAGRPVVTLIHGGFWRSKWALDLMDPMAASLTNDGCAVWNIEYRRVGHEGGGWPGTGDDVIDALHHLGVIAGEHDLDLGRHAVVGHSAGGHLALWSTMSGRLQINTSLALGLAPVSDLHDGWVNEVGNGAISDLLGGTPSEVPDRYNEASPAALLNSANDRCRQAIMQGTADEAVPVDHVRAYVEKANASPIAPSYDEFEGIAHMELIDPDHEVWSTTRDRILKAIRPLVVLTGFMGTGKSTIGRELASVLDVAFIDTDAEIESEHGAIKEIFATHGEEHFRDLERQVATSVAAEASGVVATGGGLMLDPESQRLLVDAGRVFTLTASPDEIIKRVGTGDDRPLLAGPDPAQRVSELLAERADVYGAFESVPTDGQPPEAVVAELLDRLRSDPR